MKKYLFTFIVLICGVLLLTGCSDSESEKFTHTVDKIDNDSNDYYIRGTVTNISNEEYEMSAIQFICYDSKERVLGVARYNWDGTATIAVPGQTIRYSAKLKGELPDDYDSLDTIDMYGKVSYNHNPAHYVDHCDFDKITYRLYN